MHFSSSFVIIKQGNLAVPCKHFTNISVPYHPPKQSDGSRDHGLSTPRTIYTSLPSFLDFSSINYNHKKRRVQSAEFKFMVVFQCLCIIDRYPIRLIVRVSKRIKCLQCLGPVVVQLIRCLESQEHKVPTWYPNYSREEFGLIVNLSEIQIDRVFIGHPIITM